MTSNSASFDCTKSLPKPVHVVLPNGTSKFVTQLGQIPLNEVVTLHDVLYVPAFKYNLLFVSKLLSDHNLCAIFYPDKCFFQDLSTRMIIAVGKKDGRLYFLNKIPVVVSHSGSILAAERTKSTDISPTEVPNSSLTSLYSDKLVCSLDLLRARLGHTSFSKIQHIPLCKDFYLVLSLVKLVSWQNFT